MYLEHAGPADVRGSGHAIPESVATTAPAADGHVSIRYISHLDRQTRTAISNLTPADFQEFATIRHTPTRERSLATRAVLRALLSEAAPSVAPADWTFTRDAFGKPTLGSGLPNLYFSCSHTLWMSVVAVSDRPIGIDIESANLAADEAFLAEYYSQRERNALAATAPAGRQAACARLWTLKEAVAKLLGTGLALPFSELEFESEEDRISQSNNSEINKSELQLATWSLPNKAHPLTVAIAMER